LEEKQLARADNNKNNGSKIFKMKHKVLKISLHGQIWSDFKKVSLRMSAKT
jgi:hypothetical protein